MFHCTTLPFRRALNVTSVIHHHREQADLGKFSEVVYRKVSADAKQQRFQGFRPGTIPPHLEPTYRAFAMDECAREATLEAMQQNNIRPFDDARSMFEIADVSIPPPQKKRKKKKKSKKKKKKSAEATTDPEQAEVVEPEPEWLTFDDMKGAIDAGWKVRNIRNLWSCHCASWLVNHTDLLLCPCR